MLRTMSRLFRKNQLLKNKIQQWYPEPGDYQTTIPGFSIYRRDMPSDVERYFYRPMIILILQGSKYALWNGMEHQYGANQYMVSTIDLPAASKITKASPEKPCLAVALDLDHTIIFQLLSDITCLKNPNRKIDPLGFAIGNTNSFLLDAFSRLTMLLEQSAEKQQVLGNMIKREIHYLLLTESVGYQLKALVSQETHHNKIAKATVILQKNYNRKLNMEELAKEIKMSPAAFYKDFKKITTLTPIQYQKQLRLCEAQRLMHKEGYNAQDACYIVGYESPTHLAENIKNCLALLQKPV